MLSFRSPGGSEGTATPKRKRAAGAAAGEPATKKTKGKGGKAKSAEVEVGDDEETGAKEEIKKEDAEDDELA